MTSPNITTEQNLPDDPAGNIFMSHSGKEFRMAKITSTYTQESGKN
jgi:hypothetical protein